MYTQLGRILIIVGIITIVLGIIMIFGSKIPFLGKLPGDITWKGKGFVVHFPIVTMVILSVILTVILNIIGRR